MVEGLNPYQVLQLNKLAARCSAAGGYSLHSAIRAELCEGEIIRIFPSVVQEFTSMSSLQRVQRVMQGKTRFVWMDSETDPDLGWHPEEFPSTVITSLFESDSSSVVCQEFDKFLAQHGGGISGVHTDYVRQLVLTYPETRGWVRIWVFWPSIDGEISLHTLKEDLVGNDPNCSVDLATFLKLTTLPYVTVLFTWPGDVMYIPIGRMHTVLSLKLDSDSSALSVSGGVHLVSPSDLERSRYVVANNPRVGYSKKKLLNCISSFANHFDVPVPVSMHPSRSRKSRYAAAAARARKSRFAVAAARARQEKPHASSRGGSRVAERALIRPTASPKDCEPLPPDSLQIARIAYVRQN